MARTRRPNPRTLRGQGRIQADPCMCRSHPPPAPNCHICHPVTHILRPPPTLFPATPVKLAPRNTVTYCPTFLEPHSLGRSSHSLAFFLSARVSTRGTGCTESTDITSRLLASGLHLSFYHVALARRVSRSRDDSVACYVTKEPVDVCICVLWKKNIVSWKCVARLACTCPLKSGRGCKPGTSESIQRATVALIEHLGSE